MAKSCQSIVQDKIGEFTECSICAEIFTNPKVLPCVHTFCLHCLENYGKEKQPGSLLVCPICRYEFAIPDGGLCKLPHNFFIGQMVEIRKLSLTPEEKALCNTCPEGEEKVAEMYCVDCEQILCERCTKSHKKAKHCMNHQVVELGSGLRTQEFKLHNSYCEQHPTELIKMFCHEHGEAICLICCVESHQSHRCVNIEKAAGEFTDRLKEDKKTVIKRLPECKEVVDKLDKYKKEFTEEISNTEESIRHNGTKLKHLIDQHTEVLIQNLKIIRDRNLKAFEVTKDDVDRFTVMIDSFEKYSEELLSRGSPVDICRAANQMHLRATELEIMPANSNGKTFCCDTVSFYSSDIESSLYQCKSKNFWGELTVTLSAHRIIKYDTGGSVICEVTQKKHLLEKVQVKVEPYYPWLGGISVSESRGTVPANKKSEIPTSVTFSFDAKAVHFVRKYPELQKDIEDSLKKLNCHFSWPSEGKGEVKLEFKGKENQKPIAGWDEGCEKVLQRYASELTWKKENVLQEMWIDFKQKIQEYSANKPKLIDIAFENDQCEIQYIGLKKETDEFEKIFRKIKGKLEEELERKKKRISETISNLNSHQLSLIGTKNFQRKLKQEFPNVGFEVKATEVYLCGVPDAVKKAKLFLYEKVTAAVQNSFEISESVSKLYAKDEAKSYLMQQLLSKGISASWMCNDRSVVVFALDDKNVKEAVEVLQTEVVEARLKLHRFLGELCQSGQFKDFIISLCEKYQLLEVDVNCSVIFVACMRSSIGRIKRSIERFVNSHFMQYPYNCFMLSMRYYWQ